MFEKRQDDISCWAVAEAGGIGPAAGPATVTQSALSRLPGPSSAVCTSRHRTTQGSRVSTTASQPNAPPAMRPASARASAPVATGDFSPLPSPTPTCPARAGPAPPRALGPRRRYPVSTPPGPCSPSSHARKAPRPGWRRAQRYEAPRGRCTVPVTGAGTVRWEQPRGVSGPSVRGGYRQHPVYGAQAPRWPASTRRRAATTAKDAHRVG